MNLQGKSGQLKENQKENLCLELKFVNLKLLELTLITGLISELLYDLISQF